MLTAMTRRRATFAANKVVQIVALELLYTLNMITNFSKKITSGQFSHARSRHEGSSAQISELTMDLLIEKLDAILL